ncbi:hypothetical protein JW992_06875, partial [candidate division KSB1 bacterium]|nr:hypothetical protein [candidate division KSB1 bacterium]
MKKNILWMLSLILILSSCQRDFSTNEKLAWNTNYFYRDYPFIELSYNDRPYSWWVPAPFDDYDTDENGVIVFPYKNQQYYHPVQIAQKILHFLASYHRTGDQRYIEESEKFAQAALDRAVRFKDALYFPYPFDWPFGGSDLVLRAPWVSGMAQGQMLSAFVNLYRDTQEESYIQISHEIFASYYQFERDQLFWVAFVDDNGYYWMEEYPANEPNHVLNGFIFALFGLYEYHLLNGDEHSRELFNAGLTTLEDHLYLYRVPG